MILTTCQFDPVSNAQIKLCLPAVSPAIFTIFNTLSGHCTCCFKIRCSYTHTKKAKPISNLPFLSKKLECVVPTQLPQNHFNHLTHSIVTNDLLLAADTSFISILLLLELSASFDIANHSHLSNRLESIRGITGVDLKCVLKCVLVHSSVYSCLLLTRFLSSCLRVLCHLALLQPFRPALPVSVQALVQPFCLPYLCQSKPWSSPSACLTCLSPSPGPALLPALPVSVQALIQPSCLPYLS